MNYRDVRISVIVCTYNPEPSVFNRCLSAIVSSAANFSVHEILIIDNNSFVGIEELECVKSALQINRTCRVIKELKQGLTHARLRGISESTGDLLVFIDDDNIIDINYFQTAAQICSSHQFIGAFSGQVSLECDKEPERWTKKYWGMLISRTLTEDVWSNQPFNNDTMPNGAGLCVVREAAQHYLQLFVSGKRQFTLDRSGTSLMSGGDNDLAMCACDIGKGMGLFKNLHLLHVLPPDRFTLAYLAKLAYGIYYSHAWLYYMRTGNIVPRSLVRRITSYLRTMLMSSKDRQIQQECERGLRNAAQAIRSRKVNVS